MGVYRDLLKHSAIYGLGQILSRLASLLLLPYYTRVLTPADYGLLAILDLSSTLLAILVGGGIVAAVNRFHFEQDDPAHRRRVWWTGLAWVIATATLLAGAAAVVRRPLADLLLGTSTVLDGADCLALALVSLWCNSVGQIPEAYLRVRKWSGTVAAMSVLRLLLNVALNVWLITGVGLRADGVLLGNMLAAIVVAAAQVALLAKLEGPATIDRALLRRMLAFGLPVMATTLLALTMQQSDRLLLRVFGDMDAVGTYSLALQVGQAVNLLILVPFSAIWNVAAYEIARRPDFRRVYALVFEVCFDALALVVLLAALFDRPILAVLAGSDFAAAADLVPPACLAFLLAAQHEHFRVPVLLAKRTANLVPVYGAAALVSIAANLILIPRFGAAGAVWTAVLAAAVFSFGGLLVYRRFDRYPYPLGRCGLVLLGLTGTFLAVDRLLPDDWRRWTVASIAWLAWTAGLLGPRLPALWTLLRSKGDADELVPPPAATNAQLVGVAVAGTRTD